MVRVFGVCRVWGVWGLWFIGIRVDGVEGFRGYGFRVVAFSVDGFMSPNSENMLIIPGSGSEG